MSGLTSAATIVLALFLGTTLNATDSLETVLQKAWQLPQVGDGELSILTPELLEVRFVTTLAQGQPEPQEWNFAPAGLLKLPPLNQIVVQSGGSNVPIHRLGFERRALYAPLKHRDLRIDNRLFIELQQPLQEGAHIRVVNPEQRLWSAAKKFEGNLVSDRTSRIIHANETGYGADLPKIAHAGYYLGSLGEMPLDAKKFQIVEIDNGKSVFEGDLSVHSDEGFEATPLPYQQVLEADFSSFRTPGAYVVKISNVGVSLPFLIDEGIPAAIARTYALGLFHQRCGTAIGLPYTRFEHGVCHIEPAAVPANGNTVVNAILKEMAGNAAGNPRHTAPPLTNLTAALYPFVNRKPVDVSGGHHDAGDYSKYTINSAALIHALVFAADNFPGAGDLDNLGLPESGDGKSDLLQEAKWEADFLAKMQDTDGGFYFLVYPREREYEDNVTPDHGDPQFVYPKNTAATAAAVAALAQTASSPLFKKQFPAAAAHYMEKAMKGWTFLERAIAKYGRDGSYQKLTHYGDEFMHDDELAWAACELFLATGDEKFHRELLEHFDPSSPDTRRWTWWRMFEGYGCATRSYAFAVPSKRIARDKTNVRFLEKCENEIIAAAEDQLHFSRESAYGVSFPDPTKKFRSAGWFFPGNAAFDLAVAMQLSYPSLRDPRPAYRSAMLANFNYELGDNPLNISYLQGLGWHRQREIVHQFAQNDGRVLPPTGFSTSSIQAGPPFLDLYKDTLGKLSFPSDGDQKNPFPFYDRWTDTFNTSTEFVSVDLARSLAAASWLMGQTSLRTQVWNSARATIETVAPDSPSQSLMIRAPVSTGDWKYARTVWEMQGLEPVMRAGTNSWRTPTGKTGASWVESETVWPDGRRIFARTHFPAR